MYSCVHWNSREIVDVHCSNSFKRSFRSPLTLCLSHPLTAPPADLRMLLSWQQPRVKGLVVQTFESLDPLGWLILDSLLSAAAIQATYPGTG